jgi:hypothetical protein
MFYVNQILVVLTVLFVGNIQLAGKASRELAVNVKACKLESQRAQLIFDFFSPPNGVRDLWDLVVAMESGNSCNPTNRIVRNSELVYIHQVRLPHF